MLISKDIRKLVEVEVARQLRAARFDAIEAGLDLADELADGRVPSQRSLVAEAWSAGLEAERNAPPARPGELVERGVWAGIPADETEADRDVRLAAEAAARYQKEVQSRRAVAAANRAGYACLGFTEIDDSEDIKIGARIRSLIGMRTRPTDPEPRAEIF